MTFFVAAAVVVIFMKICIMYINVCFFVVFNGSTSFLLCMNKTDKDFKNDYINSNSCTTSNKKAKQQQTTNTKKYIQQNYMIFIKTNWIFAYACEFL